MNTTATKYVASCMVHARKMCDITAHLVWALLQAPGKGSSGLNLEFGVGSARSTNVIASVVEPNPVYGFDCFQGLPEDWRLGYPKGTFSTGGVLPTVLPNVTLVHGLFKDTLPRFLAEHLEPIRFIHVDCDLYSSTKDVLDLCKPRLSPGSVLVFDEYLGYDGWELHEHKALMETGIRFEYISVNVDHEQVAIRVL